jgi:soluble lytic murein transglycosylase-like protein
LNAGNAKNAAKLAADYLSGKHQARALWVSGLAAWKQGQIKKAAGYFNELAENTNAPSPWISSAAAYWAARCWQRLGNPEQANKMLEQAAKTGMTFYGLLANAALGQDSGWQFSVPKLNANHLGLLATYPAGERAILLLDAGEKRLALQELKSINLRSQPQLLEPVIAIADHLQEAEWLMQLGQWAEKMRMANNKNTRAYSMAYGGAMFPIPSWKPSGGFSVNPALVYAIMRQESMFDPRAINPSSGATGLMQLMPGTAGDLGVANAYDPRSNIDGGARYLRAQLDRFKSVHLGVAAYNAGPGAVRSAGGIPRNSETPNYVRRVLDYWSASSQEPLKEARRTAQILGFTN